MTSLQSYDPKPETCALHLAGSAPEGVPTYRPARGRRGQVRAAGFDLLLLAMPQLNPEAGGPGTNLGPKEARPLGPGLPHPHATPLQSYPVFRPLALKAHGYHTAAESQPGARALPGQRWCPGGSEPRWLLGRRPTPAPAKNRLTLCLPG